MARQVGGVRTAFQTSSMAHVSFPDSIAMTDGLTFTVGQITWTTGSSDFIVAPMEEAQIQSASTTLALSLTMLAPTHRSLPHYERKSIDNTYLLNSIDQFSSKIAETLALVNSVQNQSIE